MDEGVESARGPVPLVVEGRSSELSIALHPLPILSISEHLTRTRLQSGHAKPRVVGALIGTQRGRDIELTNSFELAVNESLDVNHGLFVTKRDQFKQVFPTYEVMGWYTAGDRPTAEDLAIHHQLLIYNENPLFLQLSPDGARQGRDLPIAVFEATTEIIDQTPQTRFIRAPYKVETGEAERIAVEHTSKPSEGGEGESSVVANLISQRNALQMLQDRVKVIVDYLDQVSQGKAPHDHETLRQVASLSSSLPAARSPDFNEEFLTEYSDTLLTTYLATLTKELVPVNELVDRCMMVHTGQDRATPGQRGGARRGRDASREA